MPLDIDGYLFSEDFDLPFKTMITRRYVANFRDWDTDHQNYEAEFERLIKALRVDSAQSRWTKLRDYLVNP